MMFYLELLYCVSICSFEIGLQLCVTIYRYSHKNVSGVFRYKTFIYFSVIIVMMIFSFQEKIELLMLDIVYLDIFLHKSQLL